MSAPEKRTKLLNVPPEMYDVLSEPDFFGDDAALVAHDIIVLSTGPESALYDQDQLIAVFGKVIASVDRLGEEQDKRDVFDGVSAIHPVYRELAILEHQPVILPTLATMAAMAVQLGVDLGIDTNALPPSHPAAPYVPDNSWKYALTPAERGEGSASTKLSLRLVHG